MVRAQNFVASQWLLVDYSQKLRGFVGSQISVYNRYCPEVNCKPCFPFPCIDLFEISLSRVSFRLLLFLQYMAL